MESLSENEIKVLKVIRNKCKTRELKPFLINLKIAKSSFWYALKKLENKGIIKIKKKRIFLTQLGKIIKNLFNNFGQKT